MNGPHIELLVEDANGRDATLVTIHRDRILELFDATPAGAHRRETTVWISTIVADEPHRAIIVHESYASLRTRLQAVSVP